MLGFCSLSSVNMWLITYFMEYCFLCTSSHKKISQCAFLKLHLPRYRGLDFHGSFKGYVYIHAIYKYRFTIRITAIDEVPKCSNFPAHYLSTVFEKWLATFLSPTIKVEFVMLLAYYTSLIWTIECSRRDTVPGPQNSTLTLWILNLAWEHIIVSL
jgi:hypothetical protein